MFTVNKHAEYNTYSFFRDNIFGASPGLEENGTGRGHAIDPIYADDSFGRDIEKKSWNCVGNSQS